MAKKTMRYLLVLFLVVLSLTACGPERCPTVNEDGDDLEDMSLNLRSEIYAKIYPLLMDPGSYELQGYSTKRLYSAKRKDDSRYHSRYEIRFTAKNMFGGRTPGTAVVDLEEDVEGKCVVVDARLN